MPIERRKVNAWDATLAVEVRGTELDGPTVLVLHSEEGPASAAPLVAAVAAGHRVLAPTLPGFGADPRIPGLDRPRELAYLVLDLLDGYGVDEVAVIGSSLGAWVALEVAAMEPRRLTSLTLLGPVGVKFNGPSEPAFAELLVADPARISASLYADPANDPAQDATDPDAKVLRLEHREAFMHYSWEPYLHDVTLRRLLPRITAPVLIVAGSADRVPTEAGYYDQLGSALPAAQVLRIEESGHYPEIEQPTRTGELIAEFVQKNDSAQARGLAGRNGQQ